MLGQVRRQAEAVDEPVVALRAEVRLQFILPVPQNVVLQLALALGDVGADGADGLAVPHVEQVVDELADATEHAPARQARRFAGAALPAVSLKFFLRHKEQVTFRASRHIHRYFNLWSLHRRYQLPRLLHLVIIRINVSFLFPFTRPLSGSSTGHKFLADDYHRGLQRIALPHRYFFIHVNVCR